MMRPRTSVPPGQLTGALPWTSGIGLRFGAVGVGPAPLTRASSSWMCSRFLLVAERQMPSAVARIRVLRVRSPVGKPRVAGGAVNR